MHRGKILFSFKDIAAWFFSCQLGNICPGIVGMREKDSGCSVRGHSRGAECKQLLAN